MESCQKKLARILLVAESDVDILLAQKSFEQCKVKAVSIAKKYAGSPGTGIFRSVF